ncbi:fasciclin domain-containing protein [Marinilabiliaceae bacterium JC017]|nr:fasciclin domain-containing protein [Marinilabiliaceae bacterium JC017]
MKTKKINLWMMLLALMLSVSFVACNDDDDNDEKMVEEMQNSITDVAAGDENFSILVQALKKVGLDDDLAASGSMFTVFAPTNAAFVALLEELDADGLDDIPNDVLTSVLLYHVVSGNKMASQVTTGYYSSLSAGPEEGYTLSFYIDMSSAMINNRAKIIQTDIKADNGVIHAIDKVILPMSITDHAIANPSFASLVAAVTKAELASALDDDQSLFTVFAPVNDAFTTFLANLGVELADLTKDDLTPILLYHALSGFIPAADVTSGYFPTLSQAFNQGISVKADVNGGVMLNAESKVIATDVVATNGVIHAIDMVITPPTVVDIAIDNADFSILVEAVVKAELATTLSGDGPFTVFAPTNTAFEALFQALQISGINDLTKEDLTPILLAHVVSANAVSSGLTNSSVPTLNPQKNLTINIDNGVTIDGNIKVILADIQGKNGVVHVIDKVIIP